MRALIRSIPLYVDNVKLGECNGGTYEINSGDESQFDSDGHAGLSDGATTTRVMPKTIVPVAGMKKRLELLLLQKRYFGVGIPINGGFHQVDMRCTQASFDWDSKTGALNGSFTFEGGDPTVTG